jgi:hypothetical protein
MLKTGEECQESGFYRCNVHRNNYIYVEKGNKYPSCSLGPYGWHTTLWGPARKVSKIVAELKTGQIKD